MMHGVFLLAAVFTLCASFSQAGRPHISNLNLLLPPRTHHTVRHRIQGSDGCFTWSWDHHDIISVEPEYNGTIADCSTSAVITPLATFPERQATAVHATDTITGEVLRCEVFIDKISRVQIFHHSVKLDLDGWATLRIRAFDAEDNVFSTLVGLRFIWQMTPVSPIAGAATHRLLHVPLKDSPLSDCGCMCGDIDTQIALEESGYGSDLYVVRGISAGQEMVDVKLVEEQMDELEDTLILTVAEAISLEPHSPLYIVPGTKFQFKLKALRQNLLTVIPLPSSHHQWFVANSSVAVIDQYTGVVTAETHGATTVIVEDIRVKGHQQIASLYVVTPTSMRLYLSPLPSEGATWQLESSKSPWYLVTGREYVAHVLAFSKESNTRPLYLTESNDLRLFFNHFPFWEAIEIPEDIASLHGWQNATFIRAMEEGSGSLISSLAYEVDSDFKAINVEQSVVVCTPVSIVQEKILTRFPRTVYLPWSPGSSQEYRLKAEGGCGDKSTDYVWSSASPSVASVNMFGLVHSKGPGKTTIRVASVKDPYNVDEVDVEVSVPASLACASGLPSEVEVNTNLPLAVSMTNSAGQPYSRCDAYNMLVQWDLFGGEGKFKFRNASKLSEVLSYLKYELSAPNICAWALVLPVEPGRTTVTASAKVSSGQTPAFLETSWTIAAFAPLTLEQAVGGNTHGGYSCTSSATTTSPCQNLKELFLVIDSSMKVILRGGPERWRQGTGAVFVEQHKVISEATGLEDSEGIIVSSTGSDIGKLYTIVCSTVGNYTVFFQRGYLERQGDSTNVLASTRLSLICSVASSILLVVDEPENTFSYIESMGQLDLANRAPITVVNGRVIRVAAVALHATGRPFANASSLHLKWELENCDDLAKWDDDISDSWEKHLVLGFTVGTCTVRAEASDRISIASYMLMTPPATLSDAAQLQLVGALRLEPKEILLFSHADSKATLAVIGGTNDIESRVNDTKVAVAVQPPLGTRISHLTVVSRGMGTALVTILDVGLATPATASALVHVADVAWVKILLPDDASLQLGSTMEIKVQAGDSAGRSFDPSQFAYLNMRVHLQDEILEIVSTPKTSGANSFTVRGANLGLTTLHVSVQQASGRELHSDFGKVEIYSPLSIHPSPLFLTPGAQSMIVVRGGPRTGVVVVFSSSDPDIATVDSKTGLVVAKSLGNETIYAKVCNHDGVVLSETSLEVTVFIPSSMTVNVRGGQLGVGREMSLFPSANEGNLFSFYELCSSYKWSISDEEVLQLRSIEKSASGKIEENAAESSKEQSTWLVDAGFSARVVGRSPGRAIVSVGFVCHFHVLAGQSAAKYYTATDTITVVSDPPLALGMCATWVLPCAYRSSELLPQRNRAITYSVMHDGSGGSDVITLDGGHIRTSDRTDISCIHARDRSTGRSEVAVCVRVAEVAQMTIGDGEFPYHVAELSVGTHQSFSVTLRDDIGTPFYEVSLSNLPLNLDTNRGDVVSLKAAEIVTAAFSAKLIIDVQALRQGKALIRLSYSNRADVEDYILVLVGAYVYPRNAVIHVGDHVNFTVVGKGLHPGMLSGERGQWTSGDEKIIRINSRTGEAESVGDGSTTVSFNGSRLTTYTPVTVIPVSVVTVEAPKLSFLKNVPYYADGYKFPVSFRDNHGRDVGIVGQGRVVSYNCQVHPSIIGHAEAWHDISSGLLYCIFHPHTPRDLVSNLHRNLKAEKKVRELGDSKGVLRISIKVSLTSNPLISGTAAAKFCGGFEITDSPSQLQLSSKGNRTRVTLVGTVGKIEVSWERKDAMEVKLVSLSDEEYGVAGHSLYEVKALSEEVSFSDKVYFTLNTIGQREEVVVWYDARGSMYGASSWRQQMFTAVVIVLTVVGIPLLLCTRFIDSLTSASSSMRGGRAMSPSIIHDRTAVDGIVLDGRDEMNTPPLQLRSFSRTPAQPYTEYVSRTIDRTPYYSRTSSRRPDPSYTY